MSSIFTWLDHSEAQRRQTMDLLDLFRENGSVDELGVGTIRDAFADLLFPGTGAAQTRARYLLLVPWMYLRLVDQGVTSAEIAARARRQELDLVDRLVENTDGDGVIGRLARRGLQRLPSNIYWTGLKRLGICHFEGPQSRYHRSLDSLRAAAREAIVTDEGERVGAKGTIWHSSLPSPPTDRDGEATLELRPQEAGFLRDRIAHSAPGSLLHHLVLRSTPPEGELPWDGEASEQAPPRVRQQLLHARNFSELMHGSALLYNLMLAELAENPDAVEQYRGRLAGWSAALDERAAALSAWSRQEFWDVVESEGARVSTLTKAFVASWWDLALTRQREASFPAGDQARALVESRERALKGAQARVGNARARERWKGEAGTGRLSYRWPVAARICRDIVEAARAPETARA